MLEIFFMSTPPARRTVSPDKHAWRWEALVESQSKDVVHARGLCVWFVLCWWHYCGPPPPPVDLFIFNRCTICGSSRTTAGSTYSHAPPPIYILLVMYYICMWTLNKYCRLVHCIVWRRTTAAGRCCCFTVGSLASPVLLLYEVIFFCLWSHPKHYSFEYLFMTACLLQPYYEYYEYHL